MERIDIGGDHPTLAELVARVEAGEAVEIVRDGKLAARMTAAETPKKKVDVEALRALTENMRQTGVVPTESAVVDMRKSYRY